MPDVHILAFTDQHPASLGGAQVSLKLQQRFLARAGHRMTIVAPRHLPGSELPGVIELPGVPLTLDREYAAFIPGRTAVRRVATALHELPPVDLVHVQGDFWGGMLGIRFAQRFTLPYVITLHNRLDVGTEAVVPFPSLVFRALGSWQRASLGRSGPAAKTAWEYFAALVDGAAAVVAPSRHFAAVLAEHGIDERVHVIPTGVDDEVVAGIPRTDPSANLRPVLRWVGRFSAEKRLIELLEALACVSDDAVVEIVGGGALEAQARRRAAKLSQDVRFLGRVPYEQNLAGIAAADALVQTSIGFETQGMTNAEALALGTPIIVSDPSIAAELPPGTFYPVADASIPALATAVSAAISQIRTGRAPRIPAELGDAFLQSSRTAAAIELYETTLRKAGRAA